MGKGEVQPGASNMLNRFTVLGGVPKPKHLETKQYRLFTRDDWKCMLPAIHARIGELLCHAGESHQIEEHTVDVDWAIETLTSLATWIEDMCARTPFIEVVSERSSCCGGGGCCL